MSHTTILIIGADNKVNLAASGLLNSEPHIQINFIGSNQAYQVNQANIHWINETPAFYQPWRNSLLTLEGRIHRYDYLLLFIRNEVSHFIRQSLLTDNNGTIKVNKDTLQHKRYSNIFVFDFDPGIGPGGKENLFIEKTFLFIRSVTQRPQILILPIELAA